MYKRSTNKLITLFIILAVVTLATNLTLSGSGGAAEKSKSVHISGQGSRTDASFNQDRYEGYLAVKKKFPDMNITHSDMIPYQERTPYIETLAQINDLILVELGFFEATMTVAPKYPKTWFVVQGLLPQLLEKFPQNVSSYTWKDQEGAYITGIVAGMMTKTNKIGYISGIGYPDIIKFGAAYTMGARSVNPSVKISVSYTGDFQDAKKGYDAAKAQISTGVDVIQHYADDGGFGVIDAAKEAQIWVMGEIRDQSDLAPKLMLTSFRLSHKKIFETAIQDFKTGKMKHKVTFFGAETGETPIYTLNDKVPQKVKDKVENTRKQIASGTLKVPMIFDPKKFDKILKQ